jgi:hypothetical protein
MEASMAEPEEAGLVKCVERLLADKEAMEAREQKLIEDLNAALEKMGYRVVPIKSPSGTGGAQTGKKRGRPPGSSKAQAKTLAAS